MGTIATTMARSTWPDPARDAQRTKTSHPDRGGSFRVSPPESRPRLRARRALLLLGAFVLLALRSGWGEVTCAGGPGFFESFHTVLIFSDVLILLISLRYSTNSAVVFRNAGFAASTVIIRVALTAPPYISVLLGIAAMAFALALSLAYRAFGPAIERQHAIERTGLPGPEPRPTGAGPDGW